MQPIITTGKHANKMNINKTFLKLYHKIPRQLFKVLYLLSVSLMILSWTFAILQIEELILLCTNNQTILQLSGLILDYPQCEDNKFTDISIVYIVGSFAYGFQMVFLAGFGKDEYEKRLT